jgi:decaprenylphospho-beta-D-ribofuranose 2-oxidase
MYPRLDEFLEVKRSVDPHNRFTSDMARRLEIAP